MYNIDVGDTMRKILFKIKKFFLIFFSFFFHLLFDRKSDTSNVSNTLEENKRARKYFKDSIRNEKDRKEQGSKRELYNHKKEAQNNGYPSIKKDIRKVYFIQQYVEDITFRLKKENSYQELKELYNELEKYKEQVSFLQKEITKSSTEEEEYRQFISICDIVKEQIKVDEKKINFNLDIRQVEDNKQEIKVVTVKEEQKEENRYENIMNPSEKKIEEKKESIEIEDEKQQVDSKKEEKKEEKQKREKKKEIDIQEREEKEVLEEQIVIKETPKVVTKSNEKKEDLEKKKPEDTPKKNLDIGNYKMELENIRNMIRNITISKQKKVGKKISSNIMTAMLVFATLSPVIHHNSNHTKKVATALLINNKLRQSNNLLSNKKKRNLKYKTVISKTKTEDVSVNVDYILSDALEQIRQLRSMLLQFGMNNEIVNLLNQLDELEAEMLEKMNYMNTKGNPYVKKIIR